MQEVADNPEDSYKGHGPAYTAECNRIGLALGLPPVRLAKQDRGDKDRPSCAQWPHNVRPEGYYLGAWPVPKPVVVEKEKTTFDCPKGGLKAAPVAFVHIEDLDIFLMGLILLRFGKEPTPKEWRDFLSPSRERFQSGELSLPAPEPATPVGGEV
jgi:hypothetical protein